MNNEFILIQPSHFKISRRGWLLYDKSGLDISRTTFNTQTHDLHVIKKQTCCTVMTAFFLGFSPIMFYYFPLDVIGNGPYHLAYFAGLFYSAFVWFYYIVQDSETGKHTLRVQKGIKCGFFLFLCSEFMFFFSIFWAFFTFSLDPNEGIGGVWPPVGLKTWNAFGLPLTNTIILIVSGIAVTYAHQSVALGERVESIIGLYLAVLLGLQFTVGQIFEYTHLSLRINDSVFGSIFYLSTGFHGIHVIIGTLMLCVQLFELLFNRVLKDQHTGLVCTIWYWHFVDAVWIFLYIWVYVWGN